jgi:hypothetical protein
LLVTQASAFSLKKRIPAARLYGYGDLQQNMIAGCYHQSSRAARAFWPTGDALVTMVGWSVEAGMALAVCPLQVGWRPQTVSQVQMAQKSSACISAMAC